MKSIISVVFIALPLYLLSAQEPETPDSLLVFELEEIIVTANRGGGELLQIPMAVSVIGSRELAGGRAAGLKDAVTTVPGVLIQTRAGGHDVRLTVRGFGARGNGDRSNSATTRGIKVLVDGVPETDPDGRTALDLVDLGTVERIEIVRSNASMLFGNASGGVMNLETISWFSEPMVLSKNVFGSFGLRRTHIATGTPLGSGSAVFSVSSSAHAGWRRNSSSSSLHARLSIHSFFGFRTRLRVIAAAADNRFEIPGPLSKDEIDRDPSEANALYAQRRERRENRLGRVSLQFSHFWDGGHAIDLLGFFSPRILQRSERNTFRDFHRYHVGGGAVYSWRSDSPSFLRAVSLGVDEAFQDGTILFYNLVNGNRGDSLRTNKREGAESLGFFAHTDINPFSDLTLSFGARYDIQRYQSANLAAGTNSESREDRLTFRHFTPRVALLYRPVSNHSLYISVGGGLEVPAFNEVDPPASLKSTDLNPFLKPMASTTLEFGMKGSQRGNSDAFVRSLSYSLAAYRISIDNEIVPFNGGAWFFSAGRSRRLGLEAGGSLEVKTGFAVRAALTILDARYESYINDSGDFSANRVPGIPRLFFSSRFRYSFPASWYIELSQEHVGTYFSDDANTLSVPGFTLWNGTIGKSFDLGWAQGSFSAGVQNLADTRHSSSAFINPAGSSPGISFLEPGLPRNYFGGFDVRVLF